MNTEETRTPTTEKLAQALEQAHAPIEMIERARAGVYDDYKSELATNIMQLVLDARAAGLLGIAGRAIAGEFDAQKWEADEWAKSPEGQETFKQFLPHAARGPRGPYKRSNRKRSR